MRDPLARPFTPVQTPQRQPIPGREADMAVNNAGGYTFTTDLWRQLEDFAVMGATGGTFYCSQDKLVLRNLDVADRAVRENPSRALTLAAAVNTAQPARAPKPQPQLYILAAVMAKGDASSKQLAKKLFPEMVRTTDHYAIWWGYYKQMRHKQLPGGRNAPVTGRAVLGAMRSWFLDTPVDSLTWRVLKARQRTTPQGEKLALGHLLRIAHPKVKLPAGEVPEEAATEAAKRRKLLGWLAGNVSDEDARATLPLVDSYMRAQAAGSGSDAVRVVREEKVPWEFLPSSVLSDPQVWAALVDTVGTRALMRNLARMSRIGTLNPLGCPEVNQVVARLTNREAVAKARIHPMEAWLAQRVYASGQSVQTDRQGKVVKTETWTPSGRVTSALNGTFEAGFGAVTPTGSRILVVVDCSGSMKWTAVMANGSVLGSAYQVACTIAAVLARMEPNLHVIEVDTRVHPSRISPSTHLEEISRWNPAGGGTDLSLPFTWAQQARHKVDCFAILTDNETWAGNQHPSQALAAYRAEINPDARVLVATLAPTGHSIADPKDPGVLNMAGVDASLPQVLTQWMRR